MNSQNKKLVIFDFDGVIVNTLTFSFKEHKDKNPSLTWEKFQDFSNGNFHDGMIEEIAKGSYNSFGNEEWDKIYSEKIKELTITDIFIEIIKSLSSDYNLAIVSSSSTKCIYNFLLKEKIIKFSDILGKDVHKSKIVKINILLEKYNIKPEDAVFITDSLGDILEGNECGVKSIGVTWGIHPRETLEKGNPIIIIDNPMDLLTTVQNVLK
jgi:phosphoglycolate phosphatase